MQGKTLASTHKTIESFPQWVKTSTGRDISLYQNLHRSDVKPFLFIGGVHGDEPEGVRLAEDFLQWLMEHSDLNDHPWVLIPCLNPDGYSQNQRTNANGVDLNRNFPAQDWQLSEKKDRYYSGPHAASEIETQSLVQLVQKIQPRVIIHFHSWNPCVVYTGTPGAKFAELLTLGNNYEAREDIGYPTPGSIGQWGWLNCKTSVICIEEQENSDLNLVWPHFSQGLQKLIKGDL